MEQHFESFRDPVDTIRRSYRGAFNNRIDRHSSGGSSFRVEGIVNHALKTNCYVSENTQFIRSIPKPEDIDEDPGNGDRSCKNPYVCANRCTFAPPDYPHGFPTTITSQCVEPFYVAPEHGASVKTVRFPLNKSFDNVRWRTENSKNTHTCNIFDTVELVPWLSHKECLTDVERYQNRKVPEGDLIWRDLNVPGDTLVSAPAIQNCTVRISHKRRVGFTRQVVADAAGDGSGPYTVPFTVDETAQGSTDHTYLFHNVAANIKDTFELSYDIANRRYQINDAAVTVSDIVNPFAVLVPGGG